MKPFAKDLDKAEAVIKLVKAGFDLVKVANMLKIPQQRAWRLFERQMLKDKLTYISYYDDNRSVNYTLAELSLPGESFKSLYKEVEPEVSEFIFKSKV